MNWPAPGSDAAVDLGCTCPVMDNGHGRGYMGIEGVFVMSAGCPLHETEDVDGQPQESEE